VLFSLPGSVLRDPAWSPDGSQIAYAAGPDLYHPQLFVANQDGSSAVQLTQAPS
jgi:Tol biopolymer transport system component